MPANRIAINALLYAIAPQLPKALNFLLLPVLTSFLSPHDFGVYGIILGYVGGLAALKDLGLTICVVNLFVNHPIKWIGIWKRLFGFLMIWSLFFVLLQALVLYATMPEIPDERKLIIITLYSVSSLFFELPLLFGYRYFQLNENALFISVVTAISGLAGVLINYLGIVQLQLGYMSWFYAIFASTLIQGSMYGLPLIVKQKFYPDFRINIRFIKRYLRIGLPTIPHNYSSFLNNTADRIILDRMNQPIQEIGKYNFAYMFGNYVELLASALGLAISPTQLRMLATREDKNLLLIRDYTFLFQVLFLLLAFVGCLWLKEIFYVLVSDPVLHSSFYIAIIIIMGYCYLPMYYACVNFLFYHERTGELWKISFAGGILNIVLNLIFVPFFGVLASVIATFISLMYNGYAGFHLKDFKSRHPISYYPFGWLSLTVILTGTALYFSESSILMKLVLSFSAVLSMGAFAWRLKRSIAKQQ
ncbi:MAG: oligosaccharide flippase family protein [Cytophagaceae bacterium]|jgi:O-antigen/teichoic acid export membrane protein|nr:oligosaccharide flippase family protein [Cytophagaceae bacterium]